jgi:type III pantothenate kinase
MSALLIDVGNSRIKWALLGRDGTLRRQRAATYETWAADTVRQAIFGRAGAIERVIAVSVASAPINQAIRVAAKSGKIASVTFVESVRTLGGVTTRYSEPWRLGTDRLVAAIGAFAIAGTRGACVIDIGTAMTLDLIDARGVHLGGAIIPGPQLMTASLLTRTAGIQRRAAKPLRAVRGGLFARNTRDAIDVGARFAVAAAIDRAVIEAKGQLGRAPMVLLTGGAASLVRPLLRTRGIRKVPDLVLRGLAELAKTHLR